MTRTLCHEAGFAYYVNEKKYGCVYNGCTKREEGPIPYPNLEIVDGEYKYTGDLKGYTNYHTGYYAWMVAFVASHGAKEGPTLDIGGYNGPYKVFVPEPYGSVDWDQRVGHDGKISKESGIYGLVMSTETLEHLTNPYATLLEMYRCLKPGGTFLTTAPLYWGYHPDPGDYWRIMPGTWERFLSEVQFEDVTLNHIIFSDTAASTHLRAKKPL